MQQPAKDHATAAPRCLLVPTQLGLQMQAGHDLSSLKDGITSMEDDVSAVKDDVSAVKDGVKAVEEGIHLGRQAS